ncbi:VOC family protein [Sphingomonas sp. Leaf25]|uniref:VOC family protein n=1 Tax=Sphingomonas sp. Leaf25 TaxID=1735692 RepID=UPI0006FDF35C|nr:VOC family protein [Sphingomonas sp. Leaf25]KQN07599.1 lactoylglutathione lyase [Sphingomonas sp. Leaf25]
MTRMIFVNLPVNDVARATAFYQSVGFVRDPRFSGDDSASMQWSEHIVVMLLHRDRFAGFAPLPVADERTATAHLIALSLDDRAGVDSFVAAGAAAGGTADVRPPQDHGFLYGRTIADPDGHVLEPMWMDLAAFEAMQAAA